MRCKDGITDHVSRITPSLKRPTHFEYTHIKSTMDQTNMVTAADITAVINALNLSHKPICLHASLRSFGWVVGGAETVVQAFLSCGCTILGPTFSWGFAVPPPIEQRPPRNGWDYDADEGSVAGIGRIYTSFSQEIDQDMGAIPRAILAHPKRVRGEHPLCSFTAIGPFAGQLIANQSHQHVFGPLEALVQADGLLLLMGVGLTKMTLLHLAEKQAGRTLFRRWANGPTGQPITVEVGGCSDGFDQFRPYLEPTVINRLIGQSQWLIFPAHKVLTQAVTAIRQQPSITCCCRPDCERCRDAIAGGPILTSGEK